MAYLSSIRRQVSPVTTTTEETTSNDHKVVAPEPAEEEDEDVDADSFKGIWRGSKLKDFELKDLFTEGYLQSIEGLN